MLWKIVIKKGDVYIVNCKFSEFVEFILKCILNVLYKFTVQRS